MLTQAEDDIFVNLFKTLSLHGRCSIMVKELPFFPLNIVVFPGEDLNLHIFEPRYKQLVSDCLEKQTTFGIPSYVLNKIEFGTEVRIQEVTKIYNDGRMDIKTKGLKPFKVLNFINPWKEKEYAGGTVVMLEEKGPFDPHLHLEVLEACRQLFDWLQMKDEISLSDQDVVYKVIHKLGLKKEEEYELLQMEHESDRLRFILKHLHKLIPALERAEKAKELIRMNGHFKHFDPLKF